MATPLSLLDLPDNAFPLIIEHLLHTGSSPRPLITSCKSLHDRFGYVLETVEVEEVLSYQCFPRITPQWRLLQHLNLNKDMTMCLQSLLISSRFPDLHMPSYTRSIMLSSRLYRTIGNILNTAQCLNTLELNCNTAVILAKTLTHLPPRVENLCLIVQHHEDDSFEFDELLRTDLTLAIHAQATREEGLKQLEFRVYDGTKFTANFSKAFQLLEQAVESQINDNVWQRRFCLRRLEVFTEHYKVVSIIGELIYYVIICNSLTLQSIVFEGIDIDLIFGQEETPPIQIPKLRLFQFDQISNTHWRQWFQLFEEANLENEPFEEMSIPLLVYKRNSRLHIKHISEDPPDGYSLLGRKLEMLYWRSVKEQPLTRYTLYKQLGLRYIFHGSDN